MGSLDHRRRLRMHDGGTLAQQRIELDLHALFLQRQHLIEDKCLSQLWEARHDVRDPGMRRRSPGHLVLARLYRDNFLGRDHNRLMPNIVDYYTIYAEREALPRASPPNHP